MVQEVTLYRATGDYGQLGIHALEAVEHPTYYRIVDMEQALAAHVTEQIVTKNAMGDLSLTRGEALVKFLFHLEESSADLVRALKGIRALRSQVATMAEIEGITIDIGDPGAEAEGLDEAQLRALVDAQQYATAHAQGAVFLGEGDLAGETGEACLAYIRQQRIGYFPYEEGYQAGQEGGEADNPYPPSNVAAHQRWQYGYNYGHEVRMRDTADWGDGASDPEGDLKKAALNRGQP